MSFSETGPCGSCSGTGRTVFRQPSSGTLTTVDCSACSGTGSVSWQVG